MKILNCFDYLNISPRLYINRKTHYSSQCGKIMGIFYFFFCFGLSFYFIKEYLIKDEGNIIFNEIVDFQKELNFSKFPFTFKVTNSKGVSFDQNIIRFKVQHWIFPQNSNGVPIVNTIPYQRCNYKKHLINNEYKNYYLNNDFESYYCIDLNYYDLILKGTFGDLLNGYSYINLYITECKNNTINPSSIGFYNNSTNENSISNNVNPKSNITSEILNISTNNSLLTSQDDFCLAKADIDKQIGDVTLYLRIAYIDFQIDHLEYINHSKPYLRSDAILSTYKSKARIFYYFKHVDYLTDTGDLGKNFEQQTFYIFDTFHIEYPQVTYQVPEAFGVMSIMISNKAFSFKKSFQKLQILIANIGGVLSGVRILFEFIVQYFSKKLIFVYLANQLIQPDLEVLAEKPLINNNAKNIVKKRNNLNNRNPNIHNNISRQSEKQNINFLKNNLENDSFIHFNKDISENDSRADVHIDNSLNKLKSVKNRNLNFSIDYEKNNNFNNISNKKDDKNDNNVYNINNKLESIKLNPAQLNKRQIYDKTDYLGNFIFKDNQRLIENKNKTNNQKESIKHAYSNNIIQKEIRSNKNFDNANQLYYKDAKENLNISKISEKNSIELSEIKSENYLNKIIYNANNYNNNNEEKFCFGKIEEKIKHPNVITENNNNYNNENSDISKHKEIENSNFQSSYYSLFQYSDSRDLHFKTYENNFNKSNNLNPNMSNNRERLVMETQDVQLINKKLSQSVLHLDLKHKNNKPDENNYFICSSLDVNKKNFIYQNPPAEDTSIFNKKKYLKIQSIPQQALQQKLKQSKTTNYQHRLYHLNSKCDYFVRRHTERLSSWKFKNYLRRVNTAKAQNDMLMNTKHERK